ncbi:TadE/TadG family type IV pilus assembly protein [Sphingopyxis solisilvae]|uniref:TadE/TadG family type IV pilus assembly protein n=1 Tax=Sphingopyxis solisilvae TaxID=1886788 RepID=UPI0018929543|nr:TadE/TadG family type IV pilus assembly protein [Sphingopyxis solisilvae]
MRVSRFFLSSHLIRGESGASAVEFALVLPVLVALLTGIIDLGALAWKKMEVQGAARAGANYALVNATKGFDANLVAAAATSATNLPVTFPEQPKKEFGCPNETTGITAVANNTTLCSNGTVPGSYVTVRTSTIYTPIWFNTVSLSATAKVRIS